MTATDVIQILISLAAGAVVALKVIAPRTSTKVDDKVLARLEQILGLVPGELKALAKEAKEDVADAEKAKGA